MQLAQIHGLLLLLPQPLAPIATVRNILQITLCLLLATSILWTKMLIAGILGLKIPSPWPHRPNALGWLQKPRLPTTAILALLKAAAAAAAAAGNSHKSCLGLIFIHCCLLQCRRRMGAAVPSYHFLISIIHWQLRIAADIQQLLLLLLLLLLLRER